GRGQPAPGPARRRFSTSWRGGRWRKCLTFTDFGAEGVVYGPPPACPASETVRQPERARLHHRPLPPCAAGEGVPQLPNCFTCHTRWQGSGRKRGEVPF